MPHVSPGPGELLYFAYGSNLSSARLAARVPSAHFESTAVLAGFRLAFDKDGADGSAKCNIEPGSERDAVHGVVWRIEVSDKSALDAVEGPKYYTWWRLLRAGGAVVPVFTYVARPGATREGLRPYDWYLAFVIEGAREHGLPPDYVDRLHAVSPVPDPDADRAERNRRLLTGS